MDRAIKELKARQEWLERLMNGDKLEREGVGKERKLPEKGLLAQWVRTLHKLEWQLLGMVKELSEVLEGNGDKNLFDLIATLNQLLDILDRLHRHAHIIMSHAGEHAGGSAPEKDPPRIYTPHLTLGDYDPELKGVPIKLVAKSRGRPAD